MENHGAGTRGTEREVAPERAWNMGRIKEKVQIMQNESETGFTEFIKCLHLTKLTHLLRESGDFLFSL